MMINLIEYRGHIRNWKELCGQLGIDSSLAKDEREKEIITKAYEKWGRDMAEHLYGMFAFYLEKYSLCVTISEQSPFITM